MEQAIVRVKSKVLLFETVLQFISHGPRAQADQHGPSWRGWAATAEQVSSAVFQQRKESAHRLSTSHPGLWVSDK